MTGISYRTSAMLNQLWRVAVVFVLLSISTDSIETTNDITKIPVNTTESPVLDVTTESSLISHVNVTAVTGKYIAYQFCLIVYNKHEFTVITLQVLSKCAALSQSKMTSAFGIYIFPVYCQYDHYGYIFIFKISNMSI